VTLEPGASPIPLRLHLRSMAAVGAQPRPRTLARRPAPVPLPLLRAADRDRSAAGQSCRRAGAASRPRVLRAGDGLARAHHGDAIADLLDLVIRWVMKITPRHRRPGGPISANSRSLRDPRRVARSPRPIIRILGLRSRARTMQSCLPVAMRGPPCRYRSFCPVSSSFRVRFLASLVKLVSLFSQ